MPRRAPEKTRRKMKINKTFLYQRLSIYFYIKIISTSPQSGSSKNSTSCLHFDITENFSFQCQISLYRKKSVCRVIIICLLELTRHTLFFLYRLICCWKAKFSVISKCKHNVEFLLDPNCEALNSKQSAKGYERIIWEILRKSGYFRYYCTLLYVYHRTSIYVLQFSHHN